MTRNTKESTVMCSKCGVRESTGFIILMCDSCFDAFEQGVKSGEVTDIDIAEIAPEFRVDFTKGGAS